MNFHLLKHIVSIYRDHGPFCLNNAFIFEHLNDVVKAHVNSGWVALEQILEKTKLLFESNLELSSADRVSEFQTDSKSEVKEIHNQKFRVKPADSKTLSVDCYFQTRSNDFFKVTRLFKENETLMFEGLKFQTHTNYTRILDFSDIDLEDLEMLPIKLEIFFEVCLTDFSVRLNAKEITEKVLFFPHFDLQSTNIQDLKKWRIIIPLTCLLFI